PQIVERRPALLAPELAPVALAELGEALRVVREPAAERVARCELTKPLVEPGVVFPEPARPEPIDEDAVAVSASRRVVGTLQLDHQAALPACPWGRGRAWRVVPLTRACGGPPLRSPRSRPPRRSGSPWEIARRAPSLRFPGLCMSRA